MSETAQKFWIEKNPKFAGTGGVNFDRITPVGELVVFEKFNPASFIILMDVPEGTLLAGYSFNNIFFGNESGQEIRQQLLDALIKAGREHPGQLKGIRTFSESMGPLILTQWGQGEFFNYYCPKDSRGPNQRVYAGCIAVAMGQILKYYGRFNSFDVQHSYSSGPYGMLSTSIGTYDWAAMENTPVSISLEVSDFLSDLGILVDMCYGPSGSSTNSHVTLDAFHDLGYTNGVILRKSKFSEESWTEIFYQNLTDYKPILVTGGGHAFVCDGYGQDGFFHFNLGWDGYADGFYPLSGVMTLPVKEAFTELEPITWPRPPKRLSTSASNLEGFITWRYEAGQNPLSSRVYVDDQLFLETSDTLLDINQLSPGTHVIYVSGVYPEGESRWIGPAEVFIRGQRLAINDPKMFSVLQGSLGGLVPDDGEFQIYEGDLSRVISLDIDQPVISMEGIGLCNHLKRLIVRGFPGSGLDAGPLENLSELRILEWEGRAIIHPEVFGRLNRLSELRFRQTPLESLDFLANLNRLIKFEYSDAPIGRYDALPGFQYLDELVLSHVNLSEAGFVSRMPQLKYLNLSGNNISETGFLSHLAQLDRLDLSGNQLSRLLLTDQLQSLQQLDASGNNITGISLTSEMNSLNYIDLSNNKLTSPGRLFLYTPALTQLDMSHNQLRDMGKQRCQSLEILDVSYNQLIATEWISLQPSLKRLNLKNNRISDLSGLIRNSLYKQLNFLGLENNPLSRQSFLDWLPALVDAIPQVNRPLDYQPLSPCYVSPVHGSQMLGNELEFKWHVDDSGQNCVYDLYIVKSDSLVPVLQGLQTCSAFLNQRPASAFSWAVATRTADTVYFSGVYDVTTTNQWTVPFIDGFESYREGEPLSQQSDTWFFLSDENGSNRYARIVSTNYRTGTNSLELADNETAALSTEHLNLPYVYIRFSALIPPGQHGEFRVQNMNGTYYKLVWNESNIGKLYVNDRIFSTFTVDHLNWTEYEVMAHARNNNVHIKAGEQLILNETWMVPEGIICTEGIEFSSHSDENDTEGIGNKIFIDDVKITSATGTSIVEAGQDLSGMISVFPNPFSEGVTLTFQKPGDFNISIIDMAGREVYRQTIKNVVNSVHTLPLTGLLPGVYTLRAEGLYLKPVKIIRNPIFDPGR